MIEYSGVGRKTSFARRAARKHEIIKMGDFYTHLGEILTHYKCEARNQNGKRRTGCMPLRKDMMTVDHRERKSNEQARTHHAEFYIACVVSAISQMFAGPQRGYNDTPGEVRVYS